MCTFENMQFHEKAQTNNQKNGHSDIFTKHLLKHLKFQFLARCNQIYTSSFKKQLLLTFPFPFFPPTT